MPKRKNAFKSDSEDDPNSNPEYFGPEIFNENLTMGQPLGPYSSRVICPHCFRKITTRIEYSSSTTTHFLAIFLCLFCCFGWLPYITPCCRNVDHFCPLCGEYIGTYARNI